MSVVYRSARPEDNETLLALEREVPFVTRPFGFRFAVRTDRAPDYFALARAAGDPLPVVAERDGRLAGAFCGIRPPGDLWPDGRRASLFVDLRVRPSERSKGIAHRMVRALFRAEAVRGTGVYIGVILARAREVFSIVDPTRPAGLPTRIVGRYVQHALLPRPVLPAAVAAPPGVEAVPGRPEDMAEIAALLAAQHRGWALAPRFEADGLGLPPGAFFVARAPGGRLLAAAALHDTSPMRRTVVDAFGPVLGAAVALARPVAFLRGGDLPRRGEPIRSISLRHLAVAPGDDGLGAAAVVVDRAAAAARARRAQILNVGLPEGDRRAALLRPFPRDPTAFVLVAGSLSSAGDPEPIDPPGAPVYLDLALI